MFTKDCFIANKDSLVITTDNWKVNTDSEMVARDSLVFTTDSWVVNTYSLVV